MSISFVIEGKVNYFLIFRSKFRPVKSFRLFGVDRGFLKESLDSPMDFYLHRERCGKMKFSNETSIDDALDESPENFIFKNTNLIPK
jgi:hypothetical protein